MVTVSDKSHIESIDNLGRTVIYKFFLQSWTFIPDVSISLYVKSIFLKV